MTDRVFCFPPAGVVIAAVAIELMPKLIGAGPGALNTAAMTAGFILGVITMLFLKVCGYRLVRALSCGVVLLRGGVR